MKKLFSLIAAIILLAIPLSFLVFFLQAGFRFVWFGEVEGITVHRIGVAFMFFIVTSLAVAALVSKYSEDK